MASTTSYIINFNKKNSVFTLTSTKDELKVDAKHKKYEWLKSQATGRIVKISDKGRWNSSKDYNGLYKSIKPIKKIVKKSKTTKSNIEKAGAYCFSFHEKEEQFVLTNQEDIKITITSKHKKYEWLKSQDAGRVIKISDKGRWNSSKDYNGLYDEINSSKSKKKSTVKTTKRKTKSVEATSSSLKINELATLKETVLHLKNKLQVREKEIQSLKTKNTSLTNEIQLLKKKPLPAKPKPVKKEPKQYKARITATLKNFNRFDRKASKDLDITIITKRQFKKPSQSFFKSYLKFAAADGYNYTGEWPHYGLPIDSVSGLSSLSENTAFLELKITNISFIYIREY